MYNSIFQTDWWLDAVAPGRWQRLEVRKGDQVVASMPIVLKRRFGVKALAMPGFTQFLGTWIAPPDAGTKYATYLGQQKEWLTDLIEQLPACAYFAQSFHPGVTNWMPFYWKGFDATVRYTYILEEISDLARIKAGFQDNIRRDIRKGEEQLEVATADSVDELIKVSLKAYQRLGRQMPYGHSSVDRLYRACHERNAGRIIVARDSDHRVHASMFYVWDEHCTSYVIGGGDPELRNSGATSLLMWHAIQHAANLNGRFDFEGSMLAPVERFVRAFGGRQVPYFYITRISRLIKLAQALGLVHGKKPGAE